MLVQDNLVEYMMLISLHGLRFIRSLTNAIYYLSKL